MNEIRVCRRCQDGLPEGRYTYCHRCAVGMNELGRRRHSQRTCARCAAPLPSFSLETLCHRCFNTAIDAKRARLDKQWNKWKRATRY